MRKILVCLVIFCISAILPAAVVQTDAFDSDAGTWLALYSGAYTISGGKMNLACTNPAGMNWILSNNSSAVLSDFMVSVETEMQSADSTSKVGLTFRTQDNTDSYHFYVYPAGYYMVMKFTSGAPADSQWIDFNGGKLIGNSFIMPGKNVLKVVAKGKVLSFLCNGQLLTTVIDSGITLPGKIGLVISGRTQATFDNLTVDDAPVTDNGLSSLQSDFSDATLTGWKNYANFGSFGVVNQKLRCAADPSSNFSTIISDGRYGPQDTLSVSAQKVAAPSAGGYIYGMLYHYSTRLSKNTLITQGYTFCIVNGSYFALLKMDSAVSQLFTPTYSTSILQGPANVLKVICGAGGKMDLYINGTLVKSVTDNSFTSGGVGLLANDSVVVDFDDFNLTQNMIIVEDGAKYRRAPAQFNITATPNPFSRQTRLMVGGVSGTPVKLALYDASGSRLMKWEGKAPLVVDWNAETLPPGIYFARAAAGSRLQTQKVVLIK